MVGPFVSLGEKVVGEVPVGELAVDELGFVELVADEVTFGEVPVGELGFDELMDGGRDDEPDCGVEVPPRALFAPLPLPPTILGIISISRQ